MSSSAFHPHVFQNLHPFGFRRFSPLSVRSPDTLARARGTSEILFYKWHKKCSRNGVELGERSYYSVGRPPVKFRRIRSPFDRPTVKCIVVPLPAPSSDVSVFETVAGPLSVFSLHSPRTSTQSLAAHLAIRNPPSDRSHRIAIGGLRKPPKPP